MKLFVTQRQKRGGEDAARTYHGSPSKKKAVVNLVKILHKNKAIAIRLPHDFKLTKKRIKSTA